MQKAEDKANDYDIVKDYDKGKWPKSDMEYERRMIRKVTGNITKGMNKDMLPPEDTSSFMVIA